MCERLKYFVFTVLLLVLVSGCGEPKTAAQWIDVAGDQFNKQRYETALHLCDKAIALEPDNFSAYNMRAIVHGALGNSDACIRDWTKAIELAPDKATKSAMYTLRSYSYEARGDMLNVAKDRAMAKKLESTPADEK